MGRVRSGGSWRRRSLRAGFNHDSGRKGVCFIRKGKAISYSHPNLSTRNISGVMATLVLQSAKSDKRAASHELTGGIRAREDCRFSSTTSN